jgi:transposase
MSDQDARKQSLAELHERRRQVIRLHKKKYGVMQIVDLTGLSWPAVRAAIDLYEEGGLAALRPKERGREPGDGRSLTPDQEAHIRKLIIDKRPEQLKMDFALWTRAAVGELIERECGIKLCVRAVGNYLKRWGFTPQKPIRRAYERRPEAIEKWLDDEYPAIAERAKAEDGEIHWGDETAQLCAKR